MRVTISWLQSDIFWKEKNKNFSLYAELLSDTRIETHSILLLPECFSTGFCIDDASIIEEHPGPSLEWMKNISSLYQCTVAGTVFVRDSGQNFNRLYWVYANGTYEYYDKTHLYTPGKERNLYTPGTKRIIVQQNNIRYLLTTCYDLRFPVWCRKAEDSEYDIMINLANWPSPRAHHRKILLHSRAIENQCIVIGVNRIGKDGYGNEHIGESMVIDAAGNIIADSCQRQEIGTVNIDVTSINDYKRKHPFYLDADPFTIL